jgi:hypothetical protein
MAEWIEWPFGNVAHARRGERTRCEQAIPADATQARSDRRRCQPCVRAIADEKSAAIPRRAPLCDVQSVRPRVLPRYQQIRREE